MSKLTAHWWARWISEYLPTLQPRAKWRDENPGIWKKGDLVMVAEDNLPPLHWPLARITALYTGNDGHVRAARVKSPKGEYTRPIIKIRQLPLHVNSPIAGTGESVTSPPVNESSVAKDVDDKVDQVPTKPVKRRKPRRKKQLTPEEPRVTRSTTAAQRK